MTTDNQRLIEALAPHLGGGQVQHDSKGTWEWRGVLYDQRTRVQADGALCRVRVETRNPLGSFQLQWSPKFVPDPSAVDDAFDVTDEVRIWVGRCVVIQCFGLELPQQVAGFRSFPSRGSDLLIEAMQRDQASVVAVDTEDLVAFLRRDNVDAVGAIVRFTNLLAWTGAQIKVVAPNAAPRVVAMADERADARLRCPYCRALYLMTPTGRCPQCGAPAS